MGKLLRILTLRRFSETYHAITNGKPQPGLPFAEEFAALKLEQMRRRAKGG